MYRIMQSRVFTRLSRHQTKLFSDNVRLYCNHIKPESTTGSGDNREDPKGHDGVTSSGDKPPPGGEMGWVDKVVYSSYLEKFLPPPSFRQVLGERSQIKQQSRQELVGKTAILPPVSVKHYLEVEADKEWRSRREESTTSEGGEMGTEEPTAVQFPYKIISKTEFTEDIAVGQDLNDNQQEAHDDVQAEDKGPPKLVSVADKLRKQEVNIRSVLHDPPTDQDLFERAAEITIANAGTADPRIPPSSVPCGGCGAFLHCQDQSISGYISSEKFKGARKRDLMAEVCYRCDVLESHQATLNVNVSAEEYPRIVSKIRERFAMVLLLVDLTDFPCSIWPGILDIIGNRRPVFLVGNKVDMIPQDSPDYLRRLEESLIKCAVEIGMLEANILHTALISAKTGFGVEHLISTIFNGWRDKGDIFIMGCTNVGKSSLFNIFLNSDLCRPQAYDMIQKATISQWPGTTLSLLKFPMTHPFGWTKGLRSKRLMAEAPMISAEQRERHMEFEITQNPELVTLSGHVGKTFLNQTKVDKMEQMVTVKDIFQINPNSTTAPPVQKPGQWDPDDPKFTRGNWVYDTPGAVNSNQILDLLTLPELMQSLPKTLIQPRTYFIKPQMTFFVGGLFRIDFVEGEHPIRYTLFSNLELPVTMALREEADDVYEQAIGTKVFGVPSGGKDRLEQFPKLLSHDKLDLKGTGHNFSVADIVLSSIGWIAITAGHQKTFSLVIHTPNGKGMFIRQPSLLPYAINWKGKRIRGTYSYQPHKIYHPHKAYKMKRPPQEKYHLLRNSMEK